MTFTDIAKFLAEMIKRFTQPSPKFFNVIKVISLVVAVITGLPAFLEQSGVILPEPIHAIASKVVMWAGVVAAFIAQLTVKDPTELTK